MTFLWKSSVVSMIAWILSVVASSFDMNCSMRWRRLLKCTFTAYSKNFSPPTIWWTNSKLWGNANKLQSFESSLKLCLKSGQPIEKKIGAIILSLSNASTDAAIISLLFSSKTTKFSNSTILESAENDDCNNPYELSAFLKQYEYTVKHIFD